MKKYYMKILNTVNAIFYIGNTKIDVRREKHFLTKDQINFLKRSGFKLCPVEKELLITKTIILK